jgi:hypothetical protein
MNMENPLMKESSAWADIAEATDQVQQYFSWSSEVIGAQAAGRININEAAAMISPRQDMAPFGQLEQNADVQIVLDYASGITDGGAYVGSEDSLEHDWDKLQEIVRRKR